jgi:hypothetical protein
MLLGCEYKDEHAACKWACHKKFGATVGAAVVDGKFIGHRTKDENSIGLYCRCTKEVREVESVSLLLTDNGIKHMKAEKEQ